MKDIRYKTSRLGSPGVWEQGTVLDLLKALPSLQYVLYLQGRMPSLVELNAVLATGKDDAGMSGGCEWKPFRLSDEEYEEICLEFATEPGGTTPA